MNPPINRRDSKDPILRANLKIAILLHLCDASHPKSISEIAHGISKDRSDIRRAIKGDPRRFKNNTSLTNLGYVAAIHSGKIGQFEITESGRQYIQIHNAGTNSDKRKVEGVS